MVLSRYGSEDGIFPARTGSTSSRTDLSCQRIELVGERRGAYAIDHELPLADHVHELDAGEHVAGGAEGLEVEHRPRHTLDRGVPVRRYC